MLPDIGAQAAVDQGITPQAELFHGDTMLGREGRAVSGIQ
jgi:hypothetical protein